MTFLFGSHLSFRKKLKAIAKLAGEHASNLAAFACLYKVGAISFVVFSLLLAHFFPLSFIMHLLSFRTAHVGNTQSTEPKNKTKLQ